MMERRFTGRHMAAILVSFFGVVVVVNFIMARFASSTFGGIVVENSYVASQEFNSWLDAAEAQDKLGWTVRPDVRETGRVGIDLAGVPHGAKVSAVARHPLGRLPDVELTFDPVSTGALSREVLPEGRWILRMEVTSGEDRYRHEEEIRR